LRPVVCAMAAKREFVEFIGKDLREQRVLYVQHCFPMVIVEIGQSSVVSADGLGDGEGVMSGHGWEWWRAQAIGSLVLCFDHYGLGLGLGALVHRPQRNI
jgi:hypothetical protein